MQKQAPAPHRQRVLPGFRGMVGIVGMVGMALVLLKLCRWSEG